MAKKKADAPRMTMAAMEAAPELRSGAYGASVYLTMLIALAERLFPGSGVWIEMAAEFIPYSKLLNAVLEALKDWQDGKDFLQILKEAFAEWVDVETDDDGAPIRMTAKE